MKKILIFLFCLFFPVLAWGGNYSEKQFFYTYNVNSTAAYVYDADGGVAATSGEWVVGGARFKSVLVYIVTQGSTTIHVRIEGKIGGTWGQIWQKDYSAATAIPEIIPVFEPCSHLRVGLKVTTNGTDSVTIVGAKEDD